MLLWPAVVLQASLGFAGIPYVAFAGGAALFLWGRSRSAYRLLAWLAPPLVLALQIAYLPLHERLIQLYDGRAAQEVVVTSAIDHPWEVFPPFVLGLGYAYVVLVEGTGWLVLREEPGDDPG